MDHIVVPLDATHADAHAELVRRLATAAGLSLPAQLPVPHVTLIAHSGLAGDATRDALASVAAEAAPFVVRAHGFGFFSGSEPSDLSLYVPVTRTPALNALHGGLCDALRAAGGSVARWCEPDLWTPHITVLDRSLDPEALGRATAFLSRRPHPSWDIRIDRIALLGGRDDSARHDAVLSLGTRCAPSP